MSNEIQLYDSKTIDKLQWPNTELGQQAKGFLLPLMKEGVESFVTNIVTKLYVLVIDDVVLPLTVNEEEYDNSYIVSNYYAVAGLREWLTRFHPFLQKLHIPLVWIVGKFLQWMKINRVVMVNNWLFSTNLYPMLTAAHVTKIAAFLRKAFPDHVHIFRGINTLKGDVLMNALKTESFNLIGIRHVYIYDPEKKNLLSSKVLYHHRRDFRLLEQHGYEVIGKEDFTENDFPRLLELYQKVYLDRYTSYSPHYTVHFLQTAIHNNVIDLIGIKKNGIIDGIMGIRVLNGIMTVPFFGYETSIPQSVGIYRMMSVLVIKEAEKRQVILNDSSGASVPKKFRGLKPLPEYVAVYDKHLAFNRRLFWTGAGLIVNAIVFPLAKKREQRPLQIS